MSYCWSKGGDPLRDFPGTGIVGPELQTAASDTSECNDPTPTESNKPWGF